MNEKEKQAAKERLQQLRNSCAFVHLSTLGSDGAPAASYAPCVVRSEGIYVFLSQLSGHCRNLLHDSRVGALLIAERSAARNPFARQRVSYQCKAVVVERSNVQYDELLDELAAVHGDTVELLRQLPDFVLFCLRPMAGTYVEGFGRAFVLSGEFMTDARHIDEKAIRERG